MNNEDDEAPSRLRVVGANDLEQRLLDAAGREQPPRELSERMARAIGVALPPAGNIPSAKVGPTTTAARKAAASTSSALPWVGGVILAAAIAAGIFFARGSNEAKAPSSPVRAPIAPSAAPVAPGPLEATAPAQAPTDANGGVVPRPPAPSAEQHARGVSTASGLGDQITLVDAARSALAGGNAGEALALVRKYQSQYPSGAFRPEAAAIKIESLVKLGRTGEARGLAERFASTYGSGPLAERVAHVAGLTEP